MPYNNRREDIKGTRTVTSTKALITTLKEVKMAIVEGIVQEKKKDIKENINNL